MFDLSFGELAVIAILALLVLGPQRLPKAARFAGLWVRKARAQWYSVKSEFERELAADEMKRSVGNPVQDLRDDVGGLGRELGSPLRDIESELRADADAATAVLKPEAESAPDAAPDPGRDAAIQSHPEATSDDATPPAGKRLEPPSP